jgi:hypothetical protein
MVINFEFASAFELKQALGRANRSQIFSEPAKAYIFSNHEVTKSLDTLDNDQNNISLLQYERSDRLHKAFHCLLLRSWPTSFVRSMKEPKGSLLLYEAYNRIAEIMGQDSQSTYMWLVYQLIMWQSRYEMKLDKPGVANKQYLLDS